MIGAGVTTVVCVVVFCKTLGYPAGALETTVFPFVVASNTGAPNTAELFD